MQKNWIIASNPEYAVEKIAFGTGMQSLEKAAWTDCLPGSTQLNKGLLISNFPGKDQIGDKSAAFTLSLREFVLGGGCLTILGESASLLPQAFPDKVTGTRLLESGRAVFTISDPALANLAGSSIEVETSVPVEIPQAEPEGLRTFVLTQEKKPFPVVFSFGVGDGLVICQPFPPGALEKEDVIFSFLTATARTRALRAGMLEKVHSQRAEVAAEYPFLLSSENPIFTVDFSPPQGKSAMVLLYWEGDARVLLYIDDDQNRMALNHTRDSGPFAWYSPMTGGKWSIKAEVAETNEKVLPALLTCCIIDSPARQKLPQGYRFNPGRVQRCPKCKMPLNPSMKFCPACGRKIETPTPR